MSLILDALKKSEAERRRGQPPTLHMQFGTRSPRGRRMPWAAGAVLLAAGLAGGWMWLGTTRTAAEPELAGTLPPAPAPEVPAAGAPLATSIAASEQRAQDLPMPAAGASPEFRTTSAESAFGAVEGAGSGASVSGGGMPVPERAMLYTPGVDPAPSSASVATPAPVSAPPVAQASPPPPSVPPPAAGAASVVQAPVPAFTPGEPAQAHASPGSVAVADVPGKPEQSLPAIHELPYAARKELPKLELSMHVFSRERAERFIVLNGKRYTLESPAPGPELALLDIVADGAVFEFRGQRFLLPRQTF